ncbi:MAG: hypothetical protein K6E91_10270 [Butyrivibrio sp.]|nr:hypothetical protein [Butyrivibrio sp.]
MFRLWVKTVQDNHLLKDITVCDETADTRTHKVMNAIEKACYELDLPKPIWLDNTVKDFQRHAKCRFTKDSFIEDIPFDYMEIQVIEEEY